MACTDRRKTSPTIYIKLWREVCLPALLYDADLRTLNSSLLAILERCQVWFLKKVLHFPKFAHNLFVLEICNMRSIQSKIDYRKLLFFERLILKEHGNLVSELLKCRVKSYFADTSCPIGFIKEVVQLLNKYDISHHFIDWYHTGPFCPIMNGNKPSRSAFRVKKMYTGQNLLSRTNLYPNIYQHLQK